MCYQKFHLCKYCRREYECTIQNQLCPSLNDDRDANMCDKCRDKLEDFLEDTPVDEMQLEDLENKFIDEDD